MANILAALSCISSVSYIKPQRQAVRVLSTCVVYRPFPTSNHNVFGSIKRQASVVYRPFPTSNHNVKQKIIRLWQLYIVRFLHQTTTKGIIRISKFLLYIVRFLHQTTTLIKGIPDAVGLYIVRFLHQTTTQRRYQNVYDSCISSVSYIKPQQYIWPCQ